MIDKNPKKAKLTVKRIKETNDKLENIRNEKLEEESVSIKNSNGESNSINSNLKEKDIKSEKKNPQAIIKRTNLHEIGQTYTREISPDIIKNKEISKTKSKKTNDLIISEMTELEKENSHKINLVTKKLYYDYDKKKVLIDQVAKTGNFDTRNTYIPNYLILPNSRGRRLWDSIVLISIMFSISAVPVDVGWNFECFLPNQGRMVANLYTIATSIAFVDILLNFITAYINERNQYIFSIKEIIINYVNTGFLIDLLGSLPFDKVLDFDMKDCFKPYIAKSKRLMLFNLVRVLKFNKYIKIIEDIFAKYAPIVRLIKLLFVFLYLSHFIGNLFGGNSTTIGQIIFQECNSISTTIEMSDSCNKNLLSNNFISIYLYSVFYGVFLLTGNENNVITNNEKLVLIITSFISIGMMASIFGSFAVISTKMTTGLNPFIQKKIDIIKEYLEFKRIEDKFSDTLEEYYTNIWLKQRNMMYKEDFFSGLSFNLHKLILIDQWNKTFFRISKLLPHISIQFFLESVPKLVPKIFMKDDIIITEGDSTTTVYFSSKTGTCSVRIGGQLIKFVNPGDYFGEISIFLRSKRRTATITCMKDSDFLSIEGEKFEMLLRDFPDDFAILKDIAKKKLIDNIKLYPPSLFAMFVPSSDIKDYLFRKSIYLEDYQEDAIFNKVQDNSDNFVNIDRYAADFEKAVKTLEKVKKNVEKISDVI